MSEAVNLAKLNNEPYYLPLADEVELFNAAYDARLPVLLKGPTGCGKTRFVEYMAWRLYRKEGAAQIDLDVAVACGDGSLVDSRIGGVREDPQIGHRC